MWVGESVYPRGVYPRPRVYDRCVYTASTFCTGQEVDEGNFEQRTERLTVGTLKCCQCREVKAENEFHMSNHTRSGRQSHCIECGRAARRKAYRANPAKDNARSRAYQAKTRPARREASRQYRADNPILERLRRGKNRALQLGIPADAITPAELLADWERRGIDRTRCAYTGEPLQERWHMDHMVPLRYPDSPGHVIDNLVPCNPGVNRSKNSRHFVEYLADREAASCV